MYLIVRVFCLFSGEENLCSLLLFVYIWLTAKI